MAEKPLNENPKYDKSVQPTLWERIVGIFVALFQGGGA